MLQHACPFMPPLPVFSHCRDLAYMKDLLQLVEARSVAAPAPIEQRWTAGSSARMSPAAGGEPGELLARHAFLRRVTRLEYGCCRHRFGLPHRQRTDRARP